MAYYQFQDKIILLSSVKKTIPVLPFGSVPSAKPIGTTFKLKNGLEIDVNVLEEDLSKHIIGRNWKKRR